MLGVGSAAHVSQRSERVIPGEGRGSGNHAAPAPVLACIVIAGADGVHVMSGSGADGTHRGPGGVDAEALAALLERAAIALRGGSTGLTVTSTAGGASPGLIRPTQANDRVRIGHLEVVPESRLVLRGGEPVPLSRIEFDLFLALLRREGRPATRLDLVREVWGFGAAVTSRSVDTQIYNLRHKLEENPANPRYLLTVSGVGYRVAH